MCDSYFQISYSEEPIMSALYRLVCNGAAFLGLIKKTMSRNYRLRTRFIAATARVLNIKSVSNTYSIWLLLYFRFWV